MSLLYYSAMFIVLCFGSYVTYNENLKTGVFGLPLFLGISLCYTLLWWGGCRGLTQTKDILLLSLICDVLMIVAYYIGPLVLNKGNLSWHIYGASALTLIGLAWLKSASH